MTTTEKKHAPNVLDRIVITGKYTYISLNESRTALDVWSNDDDYIGPLDLSVNLELFAHEWKAIVDALDKAWQHGLDAAGNTI